EELVQGIVFIVLVFHLRLRGGAPQGRGDVHHRALVLLDHRGEVRDRLQGRALELRCGRAATRRRSRYRRAGRGDFLFLGAGRGGERGQKQCNENGLPSHGGVSPVSCSTQMAAEGANGKGVRPLFRLQKKKKPSENGL